MVRVLNSASTASSIAWLTGAMDACRNARLPATAVLESTERTSATPASDRITMAISATNRTTPASERGPRREGNRGLVDPVAPEVLDDLVAVAGGQSDAPLAGRIGVGCTVEQDHRRPALG